MTRRAAAKPAVRRPSTTPTETFARTLRRSSDKLTVSGGADKLTQALRVSKARKAIELEDDTSDEEGVDDSGSSTEDDVPKSGASSQTLARRRRGLLPFSGLGPDGMSMVVDGLSYLELSSVTQETRDRYIQEFDAFLTFAKIVVKTATDAEVQTKLLEYLHRLFLKGHGVSKVEKLMAALLFTHPEFRKGGSRHVPRFFRALKGYAKRAPSHSRKPRTFTEVCAIANQLLLQDEYFMAVYVLLAFGAYLRPTEALLLKVHDLVAPSRALSDLWSIVLNPAEDHRTSKTGISDESLIWDTKDLLFLSTIFRAIRLEKRDAEDLFDFSYHDFYKALKEACAALQILPMVPYQLRHSGPSWDRLKNHRSLLDVQRRGRWKARASLIRYEKSAMLLKEYRKIDAEKRAFMEKCQASIEDVMLRRRPPLRARWIAG